MKLVRTALLLVLIPAAASAQGSVFIQAGPLMDIETAPTFSGPIATARLSLVGTVPEPSDEQRRSTSERFAPGGALAVGVFVTPAVSFRLETSFQGNHVTTDATSNELDGLSASTTQTVAITDFYVAAAWHQGRARRVGINYVAGAVFRRERNDIVSHATFPELVVRQVGGRLVQVIEAQTREERYQAIAYASGVMAGIDVPIKLLERLALVPQLRMVSSTYEWNIRPAVTLRWQP